MSGNGLTHVDSKKKNMNGRCWQISRSYTTSSLEFVSVSSQQLPQEVGHNANALTQVSVGVFMSLALFWL